MDCLANGPLSLVLREPSKLLV